MRLILVLILWWVYTWCSSNPVGLSHSSIHWGDDVVLRNHYTLSRHWRCFIACGPCLHVLLNCWRQVYKRSCNLCFVCINLKLDLVSVSVLRVALLLDRIESWLFRARCHRLLSWYPCSLVLILSNCSLNDLLSLIDFMIQVLLCDLRVFKFLIWSRLSGILRCWDSSLNRALGLLLTVLILFYSTDFQVWTFIVLNLGWDSSHSSLILIINGSYLICFLILLWSCIDSLTSTTSSVFIKLFRWHVWAEILVKSFLLSTVLVIYLWILKLISILHGCNSRLILIFILVSSLNNSLATESLDHYLMILALILCALSLHSWIWIFCCRSICRFFLRLSPWWWLGLFLASSILSIHVLLRAYACCIASIFRTQRS